MLLLLGYVCITAPYLSCFDIQLPHTSVMGVLELLVDAAFAIDIFLNFRTGFYGEQERALAGEQCIALWRRAMKAGSASETHWRWI